MSIYYDQITFIGFFTCMKINAQKSLQLCSFKDKKINTFNKMNEKDQHLCEKNKKKCSLTTMEEKD